jgi:hypothetical protein
MVSVGVNSYDHTILRNHTKVLKAISENELRGKGEGEKITK